MRGLLLCSATCTFPSLPCPASHAPSTRFPCLPLSKKPHLPRACQAQLCLPSRARTQFLPLDYEDFALGLCSKGRTVSPSQTRNPPEWRLRLPHQTKGSSKTGSMPPLRPAHREGVDEDAHEQQEDEEDDEEDNGTPEPPPQDELHGLVRGREPEEGGVRAPVSEIPEVSRAPLLQQPSLNPAPQSPWPSPQVPRASPASRASAPAPQTSPL